MNNVLKSDDEVINDLATILNYSGATGSAATEEIADTVPDLKEDLTTQLTADTEQAARIATQCGVTLEILMNIVQLPSHDRHGNLMPHMLIPLRKQG